MSTTGPLATVVIPTHNRLASLLMTLAALDVQDCDTQAFEVVVVPNGCTDDTVPRVQGLHTRFRLRVVDIGRPSASLARNTGVDHARAPLVIFLDDDIQPALSFVSAHLAVHGVRPGARAAASHPRVVIGYVSTLVLDHRDRLAITARALSEESFDRMRQPGHRFGYTDLLTANLSMPRTQFLAAGGFDVSLRRHEGHDLGYRLLADRAQFVFAETACGTRSATPAVAPACERSRQEGGADVQLLQRYQDLGTVLSMSSTRTIEQRVLRMFAFHLPALGDLGARGMTRMLPLLDRVGANSSWLRLLRVVLRFWYERGLADAAGTPDALARLLAASDASAAAEHEVLDVDLAGGLKSALHEVDRIRPLAVNVRVGPRLIVRLGWVPGAERVAGRHVAASLVEDAHLRTFEALHAAGHVRLAAPTVRWR
jgi:glycosyltransferase involved in cell wall biosynthesis